MKTKKTVALLSTIVFLAVIAFAALSDLCTLEPSAAVFPSPEASPSPSAAPTPTSSPAVSPSPSPEAAPSPSPSAAPAVYDYSQPVPTSDTAPEDWFNDAVFLGDSRTDGLIIYSGIRGATSIAYKGLTAADPATRKVLFPGQSQECTALELMSRGTYGKIYVMFGVNELGWYNGEEKFYNALTELMGQLRENQPGADIYLQTIIPVTAAHSAAHSYIKNETIVKFNQIIHQVAEEQQVYLVDTYSAMADSSGALPSELSSDGVHMVRAGYQQWLEYLKTHIVRK